MTTTILYSIWMLFPLFFFLVFLWGVIGKFSKKGAPSDNKDIFNQFTFVTLGVVVAILVDQFVLPFIFPFSNSYVPNGMLRGVLLPVVFTILSYIMGPSKAIRIESNSIGKYRNSKF